MRPFRYFSYAAIVGLLGAGSLFIQRRPGAAPASPGVIARHLRPEAARWSPDGAPPGCHHAPTPAEVEAYRAQETPDRIILTWQDDPTRSQAVTWRTRIHGRQALAQIAPAGPHPEILRDAKTVTATTETLGTELGAADYHSANFSDLKPETRYLYRVGDGTTWSEWFQFRTASAKAEPFSFIYFGDAQNGVRSHWSRVIRNAYSDAPKARFIIHAGDLINTADNDAEWGSWFAAGGWLNGMVPSVPVPGNHEYLRNAARERELCRHWRPQFALPENGPAGLEETVYSFDYQGVRFVGLNSNEREEEQASWLDSVLRNNPNRWTVLTFHHPLYSTKKSEDNAALRRAWQPVIDRYHVDLVLQGHDHSYARSNLMEGTDARGDGGTVYVVSVSGAKMYQLHRAAWMQRAAEDAQLYQIISIDGDRLRYQARTADGDLYDGFELQKLAGHPNRLVEQVPSGVPELLNNRLRAGVCEHEHPGE